MQGSYHPRRCSSSQGTAACARCTLSLHTGQNIKLARIRSAQENQTSLPPGRLQESQRFGTVEQGRRPGGREGGRPRAGEAVFFIGIRTQECFDSSIWVVYSRVVYRLSY
jgi:hypothetical protein